MLRKIQYLLIKLIVGKRPIMMNITTTYTRNKGKEIKIELFKDKNRKWRFRLVSANHQILCSSEAYSRKGYCKDTADLIRNAKLLVVEKLIKTRGNKNERDRNK